MLNFHDEPRKTLGDFEFEVRSGSKNSSVLPANQCVSIISWNIYLILGSGQVKSVKQTSLHLLESM